MQTSPSPQRVKAPRLVIRIDKQSLLFSVTATQADQVPVFESYPLHSGISIAANLREAFKESALLMQGFKRAQVFYNAPVVWIPIEEFVETEKERLYYLVSPANEGVEILHDVIPDVNAVAVFAVSKDVKLVLTDNVPNVRFTPAVQPVWRYMHRHSFKGYYRKLYVYFHDQQIDVFAFNKHRFKFTNSFNVANVSDAIYFMMHVWKVLGFDGTRDELYLMGNITEPDECIELLHRYVQKVYAINPVSEFQNAPATQLKEMPLDLLTYLMTE